MEVLGFFWKDTIHCSIISFSKDHIDLEVRDIVKGVWCLTGFYNCPERNRKRESWDLILTLHWNSSLPWCILGDFNDIISAMDKKGLFDHPTWLINGFREVILDCNIHDVPLEGYPYTWQRRKGYDDEVEERLDIAMVTSSWLDLFQNVNLKNIFASVSNHNPILL